MKLFLDDIRSPQECASYMHTRIGQLNPIYTKGDWYIVRNFEEFKEAVLKYVNEITHISFDHDLADSHYHESMNDKAAYEEHLKTVKEKTGLDCARFVKEYYDKTGRDYPVMFVHSMNPVGTENIINVFKAGRQGI